MPAAAQIEEITVTATKREENVQDVPVAVSVLSQETIENSHAVGLEGLQALVPSASFRKGNTTRNSTVFIRGVGTISFSTAAEPSVSTVVDGVVLGRSGQAFGDLYDLERLEVLRGPQGTLFGKNASAGVVNITTRRPTEEFEGYVDLSYFDGNEVRVKGRVSGPLGDNARGSLTLFKGEFDGYLRNVYTNEMTSGYDREGFRAMLEYRN
jgi:iron complex outermembrane receptor protein